MKRRIYGKSLPPNQAASIFLMDDPTVAKDRLAMAYCAELVMWRARPATIETLLGIPTRVVTRIVLREWGEESRVGGRVPQVVSPVFARPKLHLEISLFHRAYAEATHITASTPGAAGVCITPFMTAYRYLVECTPEPLANDEMENDERGERDEDKSDEEDEEEGRQIVPENALVLARAHHANEILLNRCSTCGTSFTQTRDIVVSGSTPTRGACPYCRLIASRSRRSVVLTPMHAEQMRVLLGLSPAAGDAAKRSKGPT